MNKMILRYLSIIKMEKYFLVKTMEKKFLLFQKLPDYIRKMDGISVWQMVEQNLICRLVHTTSR